MAVQTQLLTLDDFLQIAANEQVEILDGELIKMNAAGGEHQIIGANIFRILDSYVISKDLGLLLYDGMTYLMNSPSFGLRDSFVPDLSFIHKDNIPQGWEIKKPHPAAPDLAIEIVSPNDVATDVQRKLRTYLLQGTQEVWLVYPSTKEIHQYTSTEPDKATIYTKQEQSISTALFPDIQGLTLAATFKLPKWAIPDED